MSKQKKRLLLIVLIIVILLLFLIFRNHIAEALRKLFVPIYASDLNMNGGGCWGDF